MPSNYAYLKKKKKKVLLVLGYLPIKSVSCRNCIVWAHNSINRQQLNHNRQQLCLYRKETPKDFQWNMTSTNMTPSCVPPLSLTHILSLTLFMFLSFTTSLFLTLSPSISLSVSLTLSFCPSLPPAHHPLTLFLPLPFPLSLSCSLYVFVYGFLRCRSVFRGIITIYRTLPLINF